MIGTIVNVIAVLVGSALGLLVGNRMPATMQKAVVTGLGFVVVTLGVQNGLATGNVLVPLFSIAIGVMLGEWWDIDGRLNGFGGWLQQRFGGGEASDADARRRFVQGFVSASLLFCVGPLTVLGSLADGMTGDSELLVIKSALDFFAAMALAASLGVGVAFSAITIVVVQGGLALTGMLAGQVMGPVMIDELTATGGMILIGLAIILLDLRPLKVANYLPALLIAPLIVAVAGWLGIPIYPVF